MAWHEAHKEFVWSAVKLRALMIAKPGEQLVASQFRVCSPPGP